ncbi:uncharacterized protein BYT42DRAFT_648442 [Radiomyces spectabilis]|uniref:uncharacterized protein n=1 Tax=Radiomyces spectabilis TaxID=64574 RepID=UPI00221E52B3|nr:uncharacterized protein BYT42DRAFT_648442 [Radiomyces spectabilis]KAI8368271.1 hypothetical protein BYT42DRAFT_648442 [Radiomyces spectabilis]
MTQYHLENAIESVPTHNAYDVLEDDVPLDKRSHDDATVNDETNNNENHTSSTRELNPESDTTSGSFWTRVRSLPIVQDSLGKVQHYANQNTLSRYALQQAEITLNIATQIASPYTSRYEQQLRKADAFGCRSLDMIEQKFPAVCQPTNNLIEAVKQSPQQMYQVVTAPVNQRFMDAADNIQSIVDKWLPKEEEQQQRETKDKEQNERQQQQQQEEEDKNAKVRFYRLANEVKHRLSHRLYRGMEHLPHSKSDLAHLADTNRLLQEAATNIGQLSSHLHDWVTYRKNLANEQLHQTQATANKRINDLTMELIGRLDTASAYMKEHSHGKIPGFMTPLVDFASHEYDIIRTEALKPELAPLQKASNIVQLTHAYVLPLLQSSIDGIQEQLRYYTVYARTSKNRVVHDFKGQLNHLGIHA